MPESPIRPQIYNVTPRDHEQFRALPSESRDFVPTPRGWIGIVGVTAALAWLIFQAGGDQAGAGWLVVSVVTSYFLAVMSWTVIRRERDRRDDRRDTPSEAA